MTAIAALIRHGDYHQLADTPSAHQPFPLTAEGERQARNEIGPLRELIEEKGWRLHPVIDASHMQRAWQTATILAEGLADLGVSELQVQSFDALAERGLGCAANLSVSQIEEIMRRDPRFPVPPPNWKSNSHYRLPLQGAESLMEAGERLAGHLQQRMDDCPEEATPCLRLFVGHGAAFRHAAYHLGVLAFEDLARLSMYHCRPVYLARKTNGWSHLHGDWKVRGHSDIRLD